MIFQDVQDLDRLVEEFAQQDEDALAQAVKARLLDTHTILPGIVKSYDAVKQTCTATPAIKRVFVKGGAVALPPCVDVPVVFPGGVLTFDVAAGDECVLMFSERCIDYWYANGGIQEPGELRLHDLSDAFALVGVASLPRSLSDVNTEGPELRTRAGTLRLALKPDGTIHIGTAASLSTFTPPINGSVMAKGIDPFTGVPYFVLGNSSLSVLVKP